MHLFTVLVLLHVAAGSIGLIAFWVPVVTRKGGPAHRRWGRLGARALMAAGTLAILMALLSLYGPEQRLPMIRDRALFAGLFGWMMLYLGLLTITFAAYGLAVARARQDRAALRHPQMTAIFALTGVAAVNCAAQGWRLGQPLMMLVAAIGLIAMATQLRHIWRATAPPRAHVAEHFRALIGMGISAYTAFLSVGLIRLVPDHVFNPVIWAVPSIVGIGLIARFSVDRARGSASLARAR